MVGIPGLSRNTYQVRVGDFQREIAGTEMQPSDAAIDVAIEATGIREVWNAWLVERAGDWLVYCVNFDDDARTTVRVAIRRINSEIL